jgi:hypothetical protein
MPYATPALEVDVDVVAAPMSVEFQPGGSCGRRWFAASVLGTVAPARAVGDAERVP